jgi:predicted outer membrane repeat protein
VWVDGNFLDSVGGDLTGNSAGEDGEAVYSSAGGDGISFGGTVSGNTSREDGGGIYGDRATRSTATSSYQGNHARRDDDGDIRRRPVLCGYHVGLCDLEQARQLRA